MLTKLFDKYTAIMRGVGIGRSPPGNPLRHLSSVPANLKLFQYKEV